MKLKEFALIGLLSVMLVSGLACGEGSPTTTPDLTVTVVAFSPPSGETGTEITAEFTVENQGGSASGPFSNRISLATTKWGTDYSLGNFNMDSLDPGESRTLTVETLPIPEGVPAGSYWVTVFTDGFQTVTESEEYNNIGSSDPFKFTVEAPASEAILATVDSITYRFLRTEECGFDETCYYFEIEASGTATAPVGYQLIVSQDGIWGDLEGSSWTPTNNMLKRDTGQPASITWNDTWEIFLDDLMFDGYYNLIKVEAEIYYQPTGWYSPKAEDQILIPHP